MIATRPKIICTPRTRQLIVGLSGAGAGAAFQLIMLFFLKFRLNADGFSEIVLATALATGIAMLALFNEHVSVLQGSLTARNLIKKTCLRVAIFAPVICVGYLTLRPEVGSTNATLIFFAFVMCSALTTVTTQISLAHFIRAQKKKWEMLARSGHQAAQLLAFLLVRPEDVSSVFMLHSIVAAGFGVLLISRTLDAEIAATTVPHVNEIRLSERALFALNIITDSLAVPATLLLLKGFLEASLAADVLFLYRLLSGLSGVGAAGLSLHFAKICPSGGANIATQEKLLWLITVVPFACLLVCLTVTTLFRNVPGVISGSANLSIFSSIFSWQIAVGLVGALSMLPKTFGKQAQFSSMAVGYNILLVASAYLVGLYLPTERFSAAVQLNAAFALPFLTMIFISFWLLRLQSNASKGNKAIAGLPNE